MQKLRRIAGVRRLTLSEAKGRRREPAAEILSDPEHTRGGAEGSQLRTHTPRVRGGSEIVTTVWE